MLEVLGLVPYPVGRVPGQRYRIEQWAPAMRTAGVDVRLSAFLDPAAMDILYAPGHYLAKVRATLDGYAKRLGESSDPRSCGAAFIYREAALLGPAWVERRIARRLPIVFDFDDAIYLFASSGRNPITKLLRRPEKTAEICALAAHVTAGNEHLAEYARRYCSAVTVVPSTIDTDEYAIVPRPPNVRPIVGWTGSLTSLPYLEMVRPALERLRKVVDFDLRVVSHLDASMPHPIFSGITTEFRPWRAETEADDLRPMDVGLMPLPDDDWARGKCGMKALQYMGLAIPPVVSPVGVNATIVRDGVNGFHARSEQEWIDKLAVLLRDPDLRARMGARARQTVEEGYSARVQAPRLAAILRSISGS
jgi:glycosyltransferase involved in cell wall biosynthesis